MALHTSKYIHSLSDAGIRLSVKVYCDSQSAVLAFQGGKVRSEHMRTLLKRVEETARNVQKVAEVSLNWVPGKRNPADAVSRGKFNSRNLKDTFQRGDPFEVPSHLKDDLEVSA